MNHQNGLLLDDSTTVLRRLRVPGMNVIHAFEGPRSAVPADVLRSRWDTPRGTRVRARVIRALRFERSAHLGEILREMHGAEEVEGFLDLRAIKLDGENLNGSQLAGVDLTGASLTQTTLVSADLCGARL